MAGGVNKVILIGHLGNDPEVRYTQSGKAVCNFRLATSERRRSGETGEREARTEWHNIVVWEKLAELCKEYLRKGRQAYVEGRLQTRQWNDRDGNRRYTTEVVANQVVFLGAGPGAGEDRPADFGGPPPETATQPDDNVVPFREEGPGPEDDLPF